MNQERIGKFIKEIRKKNHMTQKELADKYHVTYQAVSKWENGKNMPDMSLLKQMSKDFDISLDDLFEGEYSKKKIRKRKIYFFGSIFALVVLVIGLFWLFSFKDDSDDFEFKMIGSNCDDFNITGSMAYNDKKSSIYISDVSYCGNENLENYSSIHCTLYEKDGDSIQKIDSYSSSEPMTLEKFLNQVSFHIDDYRQECREYSKDSLYLEIEATNQENKMITYKIPLSLETDCSFHKELN